MKKIIALILCLVMVAACFAACSEENTDDSTAAPTQATPTDPTDATPAVSSDPASETEQPSEEEHVHINFNGLSTATYTAEDMAAAMGREPDFVSEQPNGVLHVYNNVEVDGLTFSQVQFTFNGEFNRISCTVSAEADLDSVAETYRAAMTEIYGEPSVQETEPPIYTWRDGHTSNYAMLTAINETTVQLAFYLYQAA